MTLHPAPQVQAWTRSLWKNLSRTQADFKDVSQNVMYSTTGIMDQFYSNINDEKKKTRIDSMFDHLLKKDPPSEEYKKFLQVFLEWKEARRFIVFIEITNAFLCKKLLDLDSNQKPSG